MIIEERKSKTKKRVRQNKSHTVKEREYFFDEQGYIFRTDAGGKFWSVSFWIPEEKREYRKSLKTKDKTLALDRGREEFLKIQGKIKNGIRVWDITTEALIEEYLKFQEDEAESGKKTKGRVGTIRSQLKHFVEFVGPKTKINDIGDDYFLDYVSFRRKKEPTVQNVTLINERSTFRNLLGFAQRKGHISKERDWQFGDIKKVVVRRDMIELEDYRKIYKHMRGWDKNEDDQKLKEQKFFVQHFILILSNTGIRFGEGRRLQWRDVKVVSEKDPQTGKTVKLIRVSLDHHKTKNKKYRIVIGRSGEILDRLKKFSNWTKPDDYLFVDNDTGEQLSKKVYYRLWNEIIKDTGLAAAGCKYTFYGLRHSYATWRLAAGVSVFDLSKVLGCSVNFIEEHYGHVDVDKMRSYLTQDMMLDEEGRIVWGG